MQAGIALVTIVSVSALISAATFVYIAPQAESQRLIIFNTTGNSTDALGNETVQIEDLPPRLAIPRNIVEEPPENQTIGDGLQPPVPSSAKVFIHKGAALLGANAFSPNPVQIKRGGDITWMNDDLVTHTVTSGSGFTDAQMGKEFDSGLLGATYNKAFDKAGEFTYFCQVHPTMVGKVIVAETTEATGNSTKTTESTNETSSSSIVESEAVEQQQNAAEEGSAIRDGTAAAGNNQGNIFAGLVKFFDNVFGR
ncbi:MAG: plastocyanin/azurin family copper-binding protein [Thermoproteota archaeon]|nr:plastocyanin/azurin family copper-binding protein [Thermoproteota archaeon]